MMREFPLFIDLIRNVETALAKADLGIARLYAQLAPDAAMRDRVFSKIEEEFHRTLEAVLTVTGQRELLEACLLYTSWLGSPNTPATGGQRKSRLAAASISHPAPSKFRNG